MGNLSASLKLLSVSDASSYAVSPKVEQSGDLVLSLIRRSALARTDR